MANSVVPMLESWSGMLGSHRYGTVWEAALAQLIWCIWGERNCGIFEDKESTGPNLKFLFLKTLYEWGLKSSTLSMFSLMDFLDTLLLFR